MLSIIVYNIFLKQNDKYDIAFPRKRRDAVVQHPYVLYLQQELAQTKAALCDSEAHLQAALQELAARNESSPYRKDAYQAVVEDQLSLICRFDADYRLTFMNRPYADLYGEAPEALLGQNILDRILPAYQSQVIAHLSSLTPQHPVATDENPTHAVDGSVRWVHWTNRLIEHPNGQIEYQGVGRDITERKQAETTEREQRLLAEAMRDSLAALTNSLDVEQVMTQILASAATVVPSEAGSIILIENDSLRVAYLRGFSPEATTFLKQRVALNAWPGIYSAFVHKTAYEYFDTRSVKEWVVSPFTEWICSSIGVPIECGGQMIGLLVADSATPNFFQPGDVSKLQAFAQYAGLALSNAYYATRLEQRVLERTAELQASEDKFRQLFQAAPIAIVLSTQAGQIMLVNNQAEILFGYQGTELLGQPIEILVPEAVRAAHRGKRAAHSQNRQERAMGYNLELFARHKSGHQIPVEIQLSYLETTDGVLVMSFILDITEREHAADALRKQRDFLQLVIDNIPDVIAVKNRQGYYQLANQALAQLLGITPAMLVGKTEAEVNPNKPELELVGQAADEVFTSKQAMYVAEQEIRERWYQGNLIPLPGLSDEDEQVLLVAIDITERKAAEVALQQALETERELSALKSGFVTNVSHEFRTPLAIILSMTETLRLYRHKLANEQIEQRLARVQEQVQLLKTMMDDVLSLERMQSRRTNFKPAPCNPVAICLHLIAEFQDQLGTKDRLLYTGENDMPMVAFDERLWRQILSNLISNAVKYSDKPINIHLVHSASTLVLTVSDKGRGIPDNELKHLFQPFYRASNVGTTPGTGLGLSITKESVELHGGSITATSQIGVGTSFTVTIPLQAEHHLE